MGVETLTKCTYCGRTDRACQTDAQVIGCDPMPWPTRFDGAREVPPVTTDSTAPMPAGGFTQSFKATVARYDDLPAGKKADYERAQKRAEPTPRQRLAEAIQRAERCNATWTFWFRVDDARAILAALQEADRREMQATIDGDMP